MAVQHMRVKGRLVLEAAKAFPRPSPEVLSTCNSSTSRMNPGAQWRPRLTCPLNSSLLPTLPTIGCVRRGAALGANFKLILATGFDGFCPAPTHEDGRRFRYEFMMAPRRNLDIGAEGREQGRHATFDMSGSLRGNVLLLESWSLLIAVTQVSSFEDLTPR